MTATTKLYCFLPLAPSVVALWLLWMMLLSSSWHEAHAWISTTTSTTNFHHMSSPFFHKQHHHQPFRSIQPLTMTSAISSSSSTSSSSKESSSSSSLSPLEYNWKDQWYALTYASYIPYPSETAEVVPAAVFGQPLVLWREEARPKNNKDTDSTIYCATDKCPHRATALSEGRVRNGTLTCLYHGWQFSGRDDGNCVRIPQLDMSTASIPKRACLDMKTCRVDEGIVWVWMGNGPPTRNVPSCSGGIAFTHEGKAKDDWITYDFQIDLSYDHTFLVENLLDPAHIDISHDRTQGGGRRENARPYEMYIDSVNSQGFTGRHRQDVNKNFTKFIFEAPGTLRQYGEVVLPNGKGMIRFGSALHCMPLSLGRCRLLFRTYLQGLPPIPTFILKSKPLWLRHLNSCLVLEQDVGLITTQEDHFARKQQQHQSSCGPDQQQHGNNNGLKDDYLLIKSSDAYVGAYRTWLDRVGAGMPWFQGLASAAGQPLGHVNLSVLPPGLDPASHRASNQGVVETRYHRHVMHSPITRNALRNVQKLKNLFMGLTAIALSILLGITPQYAITTRIAKFVLPLVGIAATALHSLESKFFVSHKRKDVLRKESGLLP